MAGEILASNRHMIELVRELGFEIGASPEDPAVKVASKAL